ncbi:hypothetical protein [Hyalangium versicolor]|uniref:hypothetical protein n=1 Tax=Hyalangium versicolor TaxID=2861190 RepID=UPI001CCC004B|nr:hypothetical protein [Hyalangium versicolor]
MSSVRMGQAAIPMAQPGIQRPGVPGSNVPAQAPRQEQAKREENKPGASKTSSGGATAKASGGGKAGGAQGAKRQEGAEGSDGLERNEGGALGASDGGFERAPDTSEPRMRSRLTVLQGEGAARPGMAQQAQPQQAPVRAAPQLTPASAPELQRQRQVAEREASGRSSQEAVDGRTRLRGALVDRLVHGMADVENRLSGFLKTPAARLGVVNLSLVMSETSLTFEVWQEPSKVPERRARMAVALGHSPDVDDASLLYTLMGEVHNAFVAFHASPAGREAMQRYENVLKAYEAAKVQPVVPGHDTGPLLAEMERLGIPYNPNVSRSLLVHPLVLAVGIHPEEGTEQQVMIAGLTVQQLGTLVAQLRRVNPRLTNRQVCTLLLRASSDRKESARKLFGQGEIQRVLESAYQLLRLQVFELFFV